MIIHLPYPAAPLWPNKRTHWSFVAKAKKSARLWAFMKSQEWRGDMPTGEQFSIQITCYPRPRGPAPDGDNINASAKAYIDGIADALRVNDRNFTVLPPKISDDRTSTFVIEILTKE
jgi:crossover junction endodeoxyribonuclease RusA